ncbi:MAG TPA: hypothetical protein VIP11_00970 [Gemmatimonadaceae bacterium]
MLTREERDYIEDALLEVSKLAPRATLVAGLPTRLAGMLPEGLLPALMVEKALDLCVVDAYNESPPVLVTLLERLLVADDRIPPILQRLRLPPPAAADPFAASVLDNKLPFLGRSKVRDYLRALTGPNPMQPVVVVVGEEFRGKSYTCEFIDYLRRSVGIRHCRIEVPPKQGASIGPTELARDILTYIGDDPDRVPPPTTNLERWTQEVTNTVVSAANKSQVDGRGWWFILDGFNKRELRDDTRLFIVKFATALNSGVAQQLHRLILIDFDRTVLSLQPGMIAVDKTEAIPVEALKPAVRSIVRASGKPLDPEKFVNAVTAGLPDPVVNLLDLRDRFQLLRETVEA